MDKDRSVGAFALWAGLGVLVLCVALGAQTPAAPRYKFDPDWPKTYAQQMEDRRRHGLSRG